MAMIVNTIRGFVDVTGSSKSKIISGMVDIVNDTNYKPNIIFHVGYGKDNIKDYSEKDNFTLKAVSGIITDNVNGNVVPLSNVRVSFIQENDSKAVVDYSVTDSNGKYTVFIEPGDYTIRIDGNGNPQVYTNQKIEEGLAHQYYFTLDSLIKKKYEDVIEFNGTNLKLINGVIIGQNKYPEKDTEIIISSGETIVSYVKTDEFGKYSFAIPNGKYDIRVRARNQSVKILKNFNFNNKGFISSLSEQSNLFKTDKWIVLGG